MSSTSRDMVNFTRCRLHSPPTSRTSVVRVIDDRHMPEPQLSSSRKRRRSEPNETSQPISKKQSLNHPNASQPPAAFWDNLSQIWLTKRALRELDRRNTQAHRPVTRDFLAEPKGNAQTAQYSADYLRCCEPGDLKDIKLFARNGGPDLLDLTNYPEPVHPPDHTMYSSQPGSQSRQQVSETTSGTRPTTRSTKSKTTGVYDRDFQQHLIDNAIYPAEYEYPDGRVPAEPNNWEDVNQILTQPRASLSPSKFTDEEFRRFRRADAHAAKEKQVSESVIPFLEGKIGDEKCRAGGIPFTNLSPLTDGTLKPGNPDIYYGARPEQLSRKVRDELGGQIIPSTQHDLPIAPNFFLAAKGPDGSLAVAGRQACYDGALGARGMHSLLSYGQDGPAYDNNANTITSTYHGGTLKMYTNHLTQPNSPGGRPEYHMTQLGAYALTGNTNSFRQGAAAYRNARDWTKEQREEAIRQANGRENRVEAEAPAGNISGASTALSFVTAVSETEADIMIQESRTSLDEDSNIRGDFQESDNSIEELVDYTLPAKRSSRRSKHSQIQSKATRYRHF